MPAPMTHGAWTLVLSFVLLAAWRGDRETTNELREAAVEVGTARGEGLAIEIAEWVTAVCRTAAASMRTR